MVCRYLNDESLVAMVALVWALFQVLYAMGIEVVKSLENAIALVALELALLPVGEAVQSQLLCGHFQVTINALVQYLLATLVAHQAHLILKQDHRLSIYFLLFSFI